MPQERSKKTGNYWILMGHDRFLIYADAVILLGENINAIKEGINFIILQ
jgi:hypothetical protein